MPFNLRSWIRRPPEPVAIRCSGGKVGDEPVTVNIEKDHPRRWSQAEQAIASYLPRKVEALAKGGNVIRIKDPLEWEGVDLDADDDDAATSRARGKGCPSCGATADHTASLIKEAYADAMGELRQVVHITTERMLALESQVHGLINAQVAQANMTARNILADARAAAAAQGNGDDPEGIMQNFMGLAMQRMLFQGAAPQAPQQQQQQQPQAPQPTTNGKKK